MYKENSCDKNLKKSIHNMFLQIRTEPDFEDEKEALDFLRAFKKLYLKSKVEFPCDMGYHYFDYLMNLFPVEQALRCGNFQMAVQALEDLHIYGERFYSPGVRENVLYLLKKYVE